MVKVDRPRNIILIIRCFLSGGFFLYLRYMKSKKFFPTPFTIALMLTAFVFVMALWVTTRAGTSLSDGAFDLSLAWYNGLWDNSAGGLYFAFQMILILVLGHVLALTSVFRIFIGTLTRFCTNSMTSAITVSLTAITLAYVNWGLALVLSALMVKHVLQIFHERKQPINVGLLGASAYASMLVWHGGLSGSSPTKAMEENALKEMMSHAGYEASDQFPSAIQAVDTIFSTMNIAVFFALIISIPLVLSLLARKYKHKEQCVELSDDSISDDSFSFKINYSTLVAGVILLVAVLVGVYQTKYTQSGFLNVNFINFCLLGLGILFHNNFSRFTDAVRKAIGDASGILIQFPLYFGIIALMKTSGLTMILSDLLVNSATAQSFPVLAFLSAGLLNFFIPSGGGQFYIQGPMLMQTANELGVGLPKIIMALSYGDQWTNMLQPFWALPLLGITKIKLSAIFPYCLALFALSGVVFIAALVLF